uniref:Uncharacterized protein n=1 Tax=Astatotilapia calliptera TaxID=8154 RepID=A0AAX7SUK2_ASTCA
IYKIQCHCHIFPFLHVASPSPVNSAVPGQESSRVVALPASVSDGSGKSQAIVNEDLGIPWSSWISTRNHCK